MDKQYRIPVTDPILGKAIGHFKVRQTNDGTYFATGWIETKDKRRSYGCGRDWATEWEAIAELIEAECATWDKETLERE